eukprot:g20804.t1
MVLNNVCHMQTMLTEINRVCTELGRPMLYAAAGDATTTAMTVQALLREDPGYSFEATQQDPVVSLLGGVGRDQLGYKLQDYLNKNGIQPLLSEIVSEQTGWTVFLLPLRMDDAGASFDRPMTGLAAPTEEKSESNVKSGVVYRAIQAGAANQPLSRRYKLDHLRFKVWEQVEAAGVVYAEATFLTVSFESVKILAEHCAKMGNTFCLSLSAPYVCRYFGDRILTVIPYTDFIFGCESEAWQSLEGIPGPGRAEAFRRPSAGCGCGGHLAGEDAPLGRGELEATPRGHHLWGETHHRGQYLAWLRGQGATFSGATRPEPALRAQGRCRGRLCRRLFVRSDA